MSIFFNAAGDWQTASEWSDQPLRYFGHALFSTEKGNPVGRSMELPSLPYRYAEGFRTASIASAHALGLKYPAHENAISGEDAIKQLNYLGFHVLRLDEFLEQY